VIDVNAAHHKTTLMLLRITCHRIMLYSAAQRHDYENLFLT